MRKILLIIGIVASVLLSGCSGNKALVKQKVDHQKQSEQETFKKNRLKTPKYHIVLKESEIVQGYDDETELLVITYDFTNRSEELLVPEQAFSRSFGAEQDLGNRLEELSTSFVPYDSSYSEQAELSRAKIKPDETIELIAVYQLKDSESEIILTAYSTKSVRKIGEKYFMPDIEQDYEEE